MSTSITQYDDWADVAPSYDATIESPSDTFADHDVEPISVESLESDTDDTASRHDTFTVPTQEEIQADVARALLEETNAEVEKLFEKPTWVLNQEAFRKVMRSYLKFKHQRSKLTITYQRLGTNGRSKPKSGTMPTYVDYNCDVYAAARRALASSPELWELWRLIYERGCTLEKRIPLDPQRVAKVWPDEMRNIEQRCGRSYRAAKLDDSFAYFNDGRER